MEILGVLAKHWSPGQTKTRLAAEVGDVAACEIYRLGLRLLLTRCAALAGRRRLVFAPAERQAAFAELAGPAWELCTQAAGDLGFRMRMFFAEAFAAGADRVVLLGADAPTVPAQLISQAFQMLATLPVVLGPAADGGYYLLGLTRAEVPVFDGIAWSTPAVWEQTVRRLVGAGISFGQLPPWYDIDRATDLAWLWRDLATGGVGTREEQDLRAAVAPLVLSAGDRHRPNRDRIAPPDTFPGIPS